MEHTKEPWRFVDEEFKIKGTDDVNFYTVIANVSPQMNYARGKNTCWANAERIVTCVNAMQGLTNEQVESLRETVKELREALSCLVRACKRHNANELVSIELNTVELCEETLTRSQHLK